jgi:hypothetical protein
MAKKSSRSGGRVTPKGTRPVEHTKPAAGNAPAIDHRLVTRTGPAPHQRAGGASAPTRAGHHRGQR